MPLSLFESLRENSISRTHDLRQNLQGRLETLPPAVKDKICIYATGSVARLEANEFSDLDAFFYVLGPSSDRIDPVHEITVFHNVISAANDQGFPDFSGGGEYLHFQFLEDMLANIGSRKDDYINGLTSRMLLILESAYLFNEKGVTCARDKTIERYFRDFHDHSEHFRPMFILNDVLRFWRTLCLNYEHRREWTEGDARKGHLNNLKLRFSRLLICYSFVAALMNQGASTSAQKVQKIAKKTPLDRLRDVGTTNPDVQPNVEAALFEYEWFLNAMNAPKDDVLTWIGREKEREEAFKRSQIFIQQMYEVTLGVANRHGYTRFVVI